MPTYSEVFKAQITVDLRDFDQVINQLKAVETQAVATARGMQVAFSRAFKELDKLGQAKVFGAGIEGVVGPKGGFASLNKAEIQEVATLLDELARASEESVGTVAREMISMANAIAGTSNIAAVDLRNFLIELESIGEITDTIEELEGGVTDEIQNMVDELSNSGKDILEALVVPWEEAYDAIVGHSEAVKLREGATGEMEDMVSGIQAAMAGMGLDEAFYESAQAWENASLDIARVVTLIEGDFQRLDESVTESMHGLRDAAKLAASAFGDLEAGAGRLDVLQQSAGEIQKAIEPVNKVVGRLSTAFRVASSEGGSAFQALRYAIFDAADAPNALVKIFDKVIAQVDEASDSFTGLQEDLIDASAAGSEYADDLRTASRFVKDLEQRHGGLRRELSDVQKMLNLNQRAWNVMANSAESSGQVTSRQLTDVRRSIKRTTDEIKRLTDAASVSASPFDPATLQTLKQYQVSLRQQEQQLKNVQNVQNAVNTETEKYGGVLGGASAKLERARGLLGRLADKFKSMFRSTEDGIDSMQDFGDETENLTSNVKNLSRAFLKADLAGRAIWKGFELIGEAAGFAAEAVGGFVMEAFGLGHVQQALSSIFTGFVDLAAEVDTLRETMETLGRNAGIPIDYLMNKVEELKESGITTAGAFRNLTTFMSQKLPIDNIANLSRAAQDMAVAFGANSTEAFERFTASIVRGSTELLDIFGIENASLMFDRYAKSIDTTANALTHAQKQQAILNGILKAAEPFAGAYENALDSVGKKMGSLVRKLEEASLKLGQAFLPVLGEVVDQIGNFASAFGEMIESIRPQLDTLAIFMQTIASNVGNFVTGTILPAVAEAAEYVQSFIMIANQLGDAITAIFSGDFGDGLGKLREFLISVGAMFKIAFGDLIADAINWGKDIVTNLFNGLKQFLMEGESWFSQAFQWGYNFVVELSSGLIDAANSILVEVMNFIGNMIAAFLAPGSPPERGPLSEMDSWGKGLMKTLAGGMASVDSSVFGAAAANVAQGLTEGIGRSFRDLELSSFKALKDAFGVARAALQNLVGLGQLDEAQLIPELQGVRNLMVDLYNIFEDTGKISEEVLSQIGDSFGEQKEDIEEYLRLQLQLQTAQEELAEIDKTIAAAARAGFVSEGLRQKRIEKANEVDELTERFNLQKEILDFQKQGNDLMLQQMKLLERIAKAQEKAAKAAKKAQKDPWEAFLEKYNEELALLEEKKRLGLISEEEYMRGRLGLEQRYIDTALRLGKPLSAARIQAFKDMKAEVEKLSGGKGKGGVKGLAEDTNELWETFLDGLEETKQSAGDLALSLESDLGPSFNKATSKFLEARGDVGSMFEGLSFDIGLPSLEGLKGKLGVFAPLFDRLPGFIDEMKERFKVGFEFVADIAKGFLEGVVAYWTNMVKAIGEGTGLGKVWDALVKTFEEVRDALGRAFERIKDAWEEAFGSSGVIRTDGESITGFLGDLGTAIGTVIDTILGLLANVIGVIGPIVARLIGIVGEVVRGVFEFIDVLVKRLQESEALKLFIERLSQVVNGLWTGILRPLLNVVSIAIAGVVAAVGAIITGIANALGPFANLVADIIELLLNIGNLISTVVYGAIDTLVTLITQGPEAAFEKLKGYIGDIVASIVGIVENILEGLLHAFQTVFSLLIGVVDGFWGMISGRFGEVSELFDDLGDQFNNVIGLIGSKLGFKNEKKVEDFAGSFLNLHDNVVATSESYEDYLSQLEDLEEVHGDQLDQNGLRIDQYAKLTEGGYALAAALDEEAEAAEREGREANLNVGRKKEAIRLVRELEGVNYKMGRAAMSGNQALIDQTAAERDLILETIKANEFLTDFARSEGLLTDELHETNMAFQEQRDIAIEVAEEVAQVPQDILAGMTQVNDEVNRLLGDQRSAQETYYADRAQLLRDGNAEEVAELDRRYKEESLLRRHAIAEALLDLNEKIMKEKLMREEITGAEAAAIVEQHRTQAQEIADHYDLPAEKARLMSDEAVGSLRAAALANDEFLANAELTLPRALELFDQLENDGYASLAETAKEKIQEMIGFLAALPEESRPSMEEMADIISILPGAYQTALLEMLDESATIDEILEAFKKLGDIKVEPEINIKVKKTGAARKDLLLMSPKTQMEEALESLVKYARKNTVEVQINMLGNTVEDINEVGLATESFIGIIERLIEKTVELREVIEDASKKISESFKRAMDEIRRAGEGAMGAITRAAHAMRSEVMGVMYALKGQFVVAMYAMGREAATGFVKGLAYIKTELYTFFIGGRWTGLDLKFFEWGVEMMRLFADGIRRGKRVYVEAALKWVASQMPKDSPAKQGPLAFTPDWGYLTEGLREQAGFINSVMRDFSHQNFQVAPASMGNFADGGGHTYIFQTGAFEGAFPNVNDEDDARGIIEVINDVVERGAAFERIGSNF